MVGRERDEDRALRERRVQSVEDAPDLEVEAAERVARLLALVAVVVCDGIVAGKGDREEVRRVSAAERVERVVQEREHDVGGQDVDERAPVDAAEVPVGAAGRDAAVRREVVAEAEAVNRELERAMTLKGTAVGTGFAPGRTGGSGSFSQTRPSRAGSMPPAWVSLYFFTIAAAAVGGRYAAEVWKRPVSPSHQ